MAILLLDIPVMCSSECPKLIPLPFDPPIKVLHRTLSHYNVNQKIRMLAQLKGQVKDRLFTEPLYFLGVITAVCLLQTTDILVSYGEHNMGESSEVAHVRLTTTPSVKLHSPQVVLAI